MSVLKKSSLVQRMTKRFSGPANATGASGAFGKVYGVAFGRTLYSKSLRIVLTLFCLQLGLLTLDVDAQRVKKTSKRVTNGRIHRTGSERLTAAAVAPPIIRLTDPAKIYNRGEAITVEVIGGAGGGFESYIANSSINVPNDGNYSIGNISAPGLHLLRFIARGGGETFNTGVLILPVKNNNAKFTVELITQVTTADVPVESSNAFTKFWSLINEARIKKAWNEAFPKWLQTQGPGVLAIGITCAATISISGGTVIGLCIREAGGATFSLFAALFAKLTDNLLLEKAINANEARIIKAVISGLDNAAGFIFSNKEKFDALIAVLKTLNDIVLAEHEGLQVTFSLVLNGASKANFMIDVNKKVNP